MAFGNSNCYCCAKCDRHGNNQKFGYVIPCSDKFECAQYLENMATEKRATELRREEIRANAAAAESARHRVNTYRKRPNRF